MEEFIAMFIVALIICGIGDALNSSSCKTSFSELCRKSNTITLTWGTFEGHGTNENGERAVIKGGFPKAIGEASKFGFKVVSNGDSMVVLQR